MPRYFNLPHSKVGNVNINRTLLTFFVFDPVDAMYATAYLFLKYDVLSEYLTPFWFAMLLNEYEIEFMFRKIRNIRNLGNVHIRGPHIVMSRTDAQNGLDFPFKY